MGLTGIQIFKLLPKTNCGECGTPTCLAFAMNLAAGKAELDACPYVSDEAREQLSEASAPPIRSVVIGAGQSEVKPGGETVLFRHEKTFYNPCALAMLVTPETPNLDLEIGWFNAMKYDRVGLTLRPEMFCIKDTGDAAAFEALVDKIVAETDASMCLMSESVDALKTVAEKTKQYRPLLYAATKDNVEDMGGLAKELNLPLVVKGEGLEEVIGLTKKLTEMGLKDLVIDSGARELKAAFIDSVAMRRAALLEQNRDLGFPSIVFPAEMTDDYLEEAVIASTFVAKYGGIVVLSTFRGENVFPLLLQRLNLYTDPQRPMVVEQGIYEIGNPGPESPVLVTSNFSLTYFIVSGEVESSKVPAWLMIMDTEGLSVLTAWAAGKFVGDAVGMFVKKSGIEERVKHKSIIIPGYAAAIAGDMEEELPGWNVMIGPREAAHIPKFLKEWRPAA